MIITSEEICKKFSRICNDCFDRNCPNPCYARDLYNVFMKVCELKDVQFATQKKTLINKACKWLKEQESWDYYNDAPCKLMSKDKIVEFRKAMEEYDGKNNIFRDMGHLCIDSILRYHR